MFKIIVIIVLFSLISCDYDKNSAAENEHDAIQEQADQESSDNPVYDDDPIYDAEIITQDASENDAEADSGENEESEDSYSDSDTATGESDVNGTVPDLEYFLEGNNNCYMMQAYFPKDILAEMLPEKLTLPEDVDMKAYYPETELRNETLPFIASFCHGSEIHDILTNKSVPEQEELMFLFPVVYTHEDGTKYMCSYSPVLYLNSRLGVAGGLYYGLRKEYHSEMKYEEPTPTSKWWDIEDILYASFEQKGEELKELPQFFRQILSSPFVTMSYPQPIVSMVFYQSKVYPETVRQADGTFRWSYEGAEISHENDVPSAYSRYFFTMSKPMNARKFFGD